MPIYALYSPIADTEVHCIASVLGFGVILLQKQNDELMYPVFYVFYYSKRTSEVESRYYSFELECLALVYGLKHFNILS